MQINEARSLLEAWTVRMKPATPPFKGDDYTKDQWIKRLELVSQDVARAAWRSWLNAGHAKWPNLYQLEDELRKHAGVGDLGDCSWCNNTGWIEADAFEARGVMYECSEPCKCDHGKMVERSPIWRDRPQLCPACNGVGYFAGHAPDDDVEPCFECNGDAIATKSALARMRELRAQLAK